MSASPSIDGAEADRRSEAKDDSLPSSTRRGAITGVVVAVDVERALGSGSDGVTLSAAAITGHATGARAARSLEDRARSST